MASVTSDRLWLTPLRTPSDARSFTLNTPGGLAAIEYSPAVTIATTQRAGGNFEPAFTPGMQQTAKVSIAFADDTDRATLEAWCAAGEPLMLRAPDGHKFACTLDSGQTFTPWAIGDAWQTSFSVTGFTYSEVSS